ncbi:hypothetical protein F4678DRAFT_413689 [Xylaria arbuscula]|nr:hypothetical protein F4678DRAFT_413689 [Xylaria arbuscula]
MFFFSILPKRTIDVSVFLFPRYVQYTLLLKIAYIVVHLFMFLSPWHARSKAPGRLGFRSAFLPVARIMHINVLLYVVYHSEPGFLLHHVLRY